MTTSNHLYTGAAIALTVQSPLVALPAALLSHFLLDALPHYGYPGRGGYAEAFNYRATYFMESVNLVGVPLLLYLLWGKPWWVWAAAFLALAPDLVWVYRYVAYERKGWLPIGNLFTRFHNKIQWGEYTWGILIEVPVFVLLAMMLTEMV